MRAALAPPTIETERYRQPGRGISQCKQPLVPAGDVSLTASELRARASLRLGRGRWLIPPWIAAALLGCAVVLIPWTGLLFVPLPRHYVANHWAVAWRGSDIGLWIA